jgi:hypothetical protein
MKVFISSLFCFFIFSFSGFSQQKYIRFVEKNRFDKLNDLVTKSLESNSRDLEANIGATLLYFKSESPFFDIKKAYQFNANARELFQEILDTKQLGKLNEININLGYFDILQDSIYYKSYQQLIVSTSLEEYNNYLNYYTD